MYLFFSTILQNNQLLFSHCPLIFWHPISIKRCRCSQCCFAMRIRKLPQECWENWLATWVHPQRWWTLHNYFTVIILCLRFIFSLNNRSFWANDYRTGKIPIWKLLVSFVQNLWNFVEPVQLARSPAFRTLTGKEFSVLILQTEPWWSNLGVT